MFFNKQIIKKIAIIATVIVVPVAVIGGYFGISNADKYRQYSVSPVNDTTLGFISAYKNAVYQGAEAILAPGFTHKEPIVQSFTTYPDFFKNIAFLLLDEKMSSTDLGARNTWSITFRSDLGSIQTGIAASMLLNDNKDVFLQDDRKLTYAVYGGLPFSSVTSFMGGFQIGVEWYNDNIVKIDPNKYTKVEQKFAGSGIEFAGGFGQGQGSRLTEDIISNGVDLLMPVAGPQIWTAQQQIIRLNKKTILIGVDSIVEEDSLNRSLPFNNNGKPIGNGKYVQFSSLKDLSRAVNLTLQIINNGNKMPTITGQDPAITYENDYDNFVDSKTYIGGLGTVAIGNIKNKCVSVSKAGLPYFDEALSIAQKNDPALIDPALDPLYSQIDNMKYTGESGKEYNYGDPNSFGLGQKYIDLFPSIPERATVLNKKNFIVLGDQEATKKIKVALSTSTSILMDSSFSQSCYDGLYLYLKSMNIKIPAPKTLIPVEKDD